MLLRESSRVLDQDIDVDAVVDAARRPAGGGYGFPAAAELLAFTSAANRVANPVGSGDDDEAAARAVLNGARAALVAAVGPDGLVEASATVAAFNGLVRVADGTGIELDDAMIGASSEVRSHLGLDAMAGAANTRRLGALTSSDVPSAGSGGRVRSLFADTDTDSD